MAKPSVQVQLNAGNNYGWQGPGWYYGHYFGNEDDYVAWMSGSSPYYGGTYQEIWIGPGWYGGFWYGNETEWRRHYHHHYYYDHHDHHDGGHHDGGHRGGGGHHGGHH